MFDNLTSEIFYYSVIPVFIITVIVGVLLIFSKKNEKSLHKLNYIIRVLLIIIIALVLPLLVGYTAWLMERYIVKGTLLSNLGYVLVLCPLIIVLIALLIIICLKTKNIFNKKEAS